MRYALLVTTRPAPVGVAPTVALSPVISGSPVVGNTLTANAGSANGTPSPAAVLARWLICATVGGTYTDTGFRGATYVVLLADDTKFFKQEVTWHNATAPDAIGLSAAVGPVTNPVSPPGPVSPPTIS